MNFTAIKKKIIENEYNKLNAAQREAVLTTQGPVLVLAGAGSGKTTVIINKIAQLIKHGKAYETEYLPEFEPQEEEILEWYSQGEIDEIPPVLEEKLVYDAPKPYEILAITFTNKAAGELKNRLTASLGECGNDVFASTFHSACVKFLRRDIDKLGYNRSFTIYDTADSQTVIKECMKELDLSTQIYTPRDLGRSISSAKDKLQDENEFAQIHSSDFRMSTIAKVYKLYQRKLKENNALDFDDLILKTVELFEECPEVLEQYQNRFKYILVDEFQDTNRAQYRLISLLAKGHGNLCVVGDDDQSIYKFRGADISNILGFEKEFKDAKVIRLEKNYRSTGTILEAANHVIANNYGRKGKTLLPTAEKGEPIQVYVASGSSSEALHVVQTIMSIDEQFSNSVVLYRVNAQSRAVEDAFVRAGVPYRVLGGLKFYDRKEIKDLTSYLRLILSHEDNLAFRRVINEPKRGIGGSTLEILEEIAEREERPLFEICESAELMGDAMNEARTAKFLQFAKMIKDWYEDTEKGVPITQIVRRVMNESGIIAEYQKKPTVENQTRIENLNEFLNMVQEAEKAEPGITLAQFMENIVLLSDVDNYDENQDCVTLMTIHSAKGLEFDNVFVIGMEESIFPSSRSFDSQAELEEERRLCYVAITRAKKRLFLSRAKVRIIYGGTKYNRPSRFLDEIPSNLIEELSEIPEKKMNRGDFQRMQANAFESAIRNSEVGFENEKSETANAAGGRKSAFHNGDRVKHKRFGTGTVIEAQAMGTDSFLKVKFDTAGEKNLMAAYAGLEFAD